MDEVSPAGAEAVAVYFLELFPYVFATGDVEDYRALSHPECIYCANVLTHAEQVMTAGQRSEGGLVEASGISSSEIDVDRWWLVRLTLTEQPSTTLDGDGVVVDEFPGVKIYDSDVAVMHDEGRWLVREVTHTRRD